MAYVELHLTNLCIMFLIHGNECLYVYISIYYYRIQNKQYIDCKVKKTCVCCVDYSETMLKAYTSWSVLITDVCCVFSRYCE